MTLGQPHHHHLGLPYLSNQLTKSALAMPGTRLRYNLGTAAAVPPIATRKIVCRCRPRYSQHVISHSGQTPVFAFGVSRANATLVLILCRSLCSPRRTLSSRPLFSLWVYLACTSLELSQHAAIVLSAILCTLDALYSACSPLSHRIPGSYYVLSRSCARFRDDNQSRLELGCTFVTFVWDYT
ncbi:hypothetical protein OE88DRAFT_1094440 [Heliocybe sulcata]|uniref:Uncharacterized protein n=1 Tax=Heliocybe sulcata TaxID=5364 RepID=A0A5C3MWB6_9AGAM|nr:hypothetical protein OE88DRAFT_1094440 [Heliocybe sulcata]